MPLLGRKRKPCLPGASPPRSNPTFRYAPGWPCGRGATTTPRPSGRPSTVRRSSGGTSGASTATTRRGRGRRSGRAVGVTRRPRVGRSSTPTTDRWVRWGCGGVLLVEASAHLSYWLVPAARGRGDRHRGAGGTHPVEFHRGPVCTAGSGALDRQYGVVPGGHAGRLSGGGRAPGVGSPRRWLARHAPARTAAHRRSDLIRLSARMVSASRRPRRRVASPAAVAARRGRWPPGPPTPATTRVTGADVASSRTPPAR